MKKIEIFLDDEIYDLFVELCRKVTKARSRVGRYIITSYLQKLK